MFHWYSNNFRVDEHNPNYTAVDGVIFSKDKKTLTAVPGGRTSYDIPDGTESVGAFAFEGCGLIESVTIPDSVSAIIRLSRGAGLLKR